MVFALFAIICFGPGRFSWWKGLATVFALGAALRVSVGVLTTTFEEMPTSAS
jgi:hypothetical protein